MHVRPPPHFDTFSRNNLSLKRDKQLSKHFLKRYWQIASSPTVNFCITVLNPIIKHSPD